MSLVSAACFGVAALIVLSCFRKGADLLSPFRVFGFVWSVAIGLTDLKESLYQNIWSAAAWWELILGVVAFLLGVFICHVLYMRVKLLTIPEVRRHLQEEFRVSMDGRALLGFTVLLFIAYLASFLTETAIVGQLPISSPHPERARVTFGVFGLPLIVNFVLTIMLLVVEYLILVPRPRWGRYAMMAMFLFSAGTFFMLLERYTYFIWAVMALGFAYYASTNFRLRKVAIVGAGLAAALILIQSLRSAVYIEHYFYFVSKLRFSREYAVFAEPYMYVVMNLENFARGVDHLDKASYGYFTFDWVLALTGLKHWLADYFDIVRLPYLNSDYNTFTFQWTFYYDFGTLGVGIGSLIMGFLIGMGYYRLRRFPSFINVYWYATGLLFMVNSFRENPLTRLDIVSNLFLIMGVHHFLLRRTRRARAPDTGAVGA